MKKRPRKANPVSAILKAISELSTADALLLADAMNDAAYHRLMISHPEVDRAMDEGRPLPKPLPQSLIDTHKADPIAFVVTTLEARLCGTGGSNVNNLVGALDDVGRRFQAVLPKLAKHRALATSKPDPEKRRIVTEARELMRAKRWSAKVAASHLRVDYDDLRNWMRRYSSSM